jgi:hypothetical protein
MYYDFIKSALVLAEIIIEQAKLVIRIDDRPFFGQLNSLINILEIARYLLSVRLERIVMDDLSNHHVFTILRSSRD